MEYWTIAFYEKKSKTSYVVYEGRDDGRYYLGGGAGTLHPLLFALKKDAEKALERVRMVENDKRNERSWSMDGRFLVTKCSIEI